MLAGGAARRFGSDKALAIYRGRPLIEHVLAALARETDAVVVTGRDWTGGIGIADNPGPGLGPLGGLCAALHHGAALGFDAVLSAGCDLPALPDGLGALLRPGPAHGAAQPTIGLWPVTLAPVLAAHIDAGGRSLYGWAEARGARAVDIGALPNINTPGDLAGLAERFGVGT